MTTERTRAGAAAAWGIGQVGLGSITTAHREGYRLYGQPVVAGYDPDPAARARLAADTPAAVVHGDLADLLADPAVGVVDLATPHHRSTRLPVVEQIAAAGKPFLVQKPMAMSYADALELVEVAEAAGVTGMVNQNMCFTPSAIALSRALLDDRVVGEPSYAQLVAQYQFDLPDHPWFGKDERWWTAGLTVHHLGLLQMLFGPPEQVHAMTGHDVSQPGVTSDGWGHLALRYRSGLQLVLVSTGTYYGTEPVPHGNEAVWVQGPEGLVDWRPEGDVVVSTRVGGGSQVERRSIAPHVRGTWFPHAFGLTMAHLRQALAAGRTPLCSVQDNLAVMAVLEATYTSGQQRRVVEVAEVMGDRYDPAYGSGWSHGFSGWEPPLPVTAPETAAAQALA
ncbi:Gfo/Idh/MocA family protein [Quadrisphaera setariae]|uniref:Gfo/Idh/MocA family oxidoreductase n=1 Tax=Quadrisphaera setariae TaxID=2593304 RepID=A0A5C8ZK69_9ACTN|nr:Gfo/Idh/MocA family oxidoreductase [Quadrisphaera setariae]TXR58014.1 Gfo/Idh/MocA family oxidoreductase [Quadrisphaera setariae]